MKRVSSPQQGPPNSSSMSLSERLQEVFLQLATTKLWLGTVVLGVLSCALIAIAFHQHALTTRNVWVYIELQVGTGLLVAAVGTALLKSLTVRVDQQLQENLAGLRKQDLSDIASGVTEIKTALSDHDFREAEEGARILRAIGVNNLYVNRIGAISAMAEALLDPEVTDIALMGNALNEFRTSGRDDLARAWSAIEEYVRDPRRLDESRSRLAVRVLLIDPYCLGAHLWCHGRTKDITLERADRLESDVRLNADHLLRLEKEVRAQSPEVDVSFQVRLHRLSPQFFMLQTNQVGFMQSYYLSERMELTAPVIRHSSDTSQYRSVRSHFETMWTYASVDCSAVFQQFARGIDKGAQEAGIVSIYADPETARGRVLSLLSGARERVWIYSMGMYLMLHSPLDKMLEDLVHRDGLDIRLLILDPDSENSHTKSFRQSLAQRTRASGEGLSWAQYLADQLGHRNSIHYERIHDAIRMINHLARDATGASFRARMYAAAPVGFVLFVDDTVLVEQYHYGKNSGMRNQRSTLELAQEMALVEYRRPASTLFSALQPFNPFTVIEDHFNFVFERFADPISHGGQAASG